MYCTARRHIFYGAFSPIYFKALQEVPAFQITLHRVTWSFLLMALIMLLRRDWRSLIKNASNWRTLAIYAAAAVLLGANWLLFTYRGVNAGFVVEASLGYFINPLVNVLLGTLVLRGTLRRVGNGFRGLATAGVVVPGRDSRAACPGSRWGWPVALAFTACSKKLLRWVRFKASSLETAILFLPALGYLIFAETQGIGAFGHVAWSTSLLLALTGVITTIPLLLFASGARRIPLHHPGVASICCAHPAVLDRGDFYIM